MEKHSGMEWSGGVACSEVADGRLLASPAAAVRIPASDTRPASNAFLAVGVLCVTEIPTVSTFSLRHVHSCGSNTAKTVLRLMHSPHAYPMYSFSFRTDGVAQGRFSCRPTRTKRKSTPERNGM